MGAAGGDSGAGLPPIHAHCPQRRSAELEVTGGGAAKEGREAEVSPERGRPSTGRGARSGRAAGGDVLAEWAPRPAAERLSSAGEGRRGRSLLRSYLR